MKYVWAEIRKLKITKDTIAKLDTSRQIETWDIPEFRGRKRVVSLKDQACAAYFTYLATEFSFPRTVWTRAKSDELAEPWLSAAKLCHQQSRSVTNKELAKSLALVGIYLDKQGRLREQKGSPFVVAKSRGKDEIRARVLALAIETHSMFGTPLYGTVARAANVALGISAVTRTDVENYWTLHRKNQ